LLTANQIVALACEAAHSPGKTSQAQQLLNLILSDLCQTYDLAMARGLFSFTMIPTLTGAVGNQNVYASGPYTLPADYLRTSGSSGSTGTQNSVIWFNLGVPYPLIPCDLAEFDLQVQQAGQQSYPYLYVTDMSQSPPVAYVWPPPSGAFPVNVRYQRQMPDIVWTGANATAGNPPWFTNTGYLTKKLLAKLCSLNDDTRAETLDAGPDVVGSADHDLARWLSQIDDSSSHPKRVTLDRRRFRVPFSKLPSTKQVGW
jgi:hypothetical protein